MTRDAEKGNDDNNHATIYVTKEETDGTESA